MHAKAVDLKANRDLIDPHFDGYKLSLDHLPAYKVALSLGADTVSIRDDQYTYQHVKAFGIHNYLYSDAWNSELLFYVDEAWNVMRHDTSQGPPLEPPVSVYQIPGASELRGRNDRLNVTLHCTSLEWVILGDGAGHVYLLKTDSRKEDKNWTVCYKGCPITCADPDSPSPTPCVVLHSVLRRAEDTAAIEALLLHVEKNLEADNENRAPPYLTKVTWITLSQVDKDKWELVRTRQLSGASSPDYAALEPDGQSILLASQKPFTFLYDSEKAVQKDVTTEQGGTSGDASKDELSSYVWSQSSEDITIYIPLSEDVTKPDVIYKLTPDAIHVAVKNQREELLKGALSGRVEVDGSTWTLSKEQGQNKLCIHLEKASPGSAWSEIVVGDRGGNLVPDDATLAEIHQRLAHLTSDKPNPDPDGSEKAYNSQELEDCDIYPDDSSSLQRYDGDGHNVTHQANLGSHQWLFCIPPTEARMPCFCLRHDVDGLIWQPQTPSGDNSTPWEHIATFNAFGYVQASKQQKKFTSSSPDFSYAVICDCSRHLYIYRQPSAILSPLRNRKTGREVAALAKQQVVSLDTMDNIEGLHVTNDKVYILIGKALHMIRVNIIEA